MMSFGHMTIAKSTNEPLNTRISKINVINKMTIVIALLEVYSIGKQYQNQEWDVWKQFSLWWDDDLDGLKVNEAYRCQNYQ